MMQSQSSVHLGPLGLINSTTQPGRNGVAGARKGKLIYFRHLSQSFAEGKSYSTVNTYQLFEDFVPFRTT